MMARSPSGGCEVDEWAKARWQTRASNIVMVEALAPVQAVATMGRTRPGAHVVVLVDNEAAEGALAKGYSPQEDLGDLTAVFWEAVLEFGLSVYVDRVPTDTNLADGPSRGRFDELVDAGAAFHKTVTPRQVADGTWMPRGLGKRALAGAGVKMGFCARSPTLGLRGQSFGITRTSPKAVARLRFVCVE